MKKDLRYFLMAGCLLLLQQTGISQTLSNTTNTITLTNTCLNPVFASGTYTLTLGYNDLENGFTNVPSVPGCTVTSNGTTLTITVPGANYPAVPNTYYFLGDCDNGSIALTGGPTSGVIYWYHEPDGTIRFNCVALPIYFSNFHGTASSGTTLLTWQTQTEQNSTVIEIYRAGAGGADFYKIGQVTAAGNSTMPVSYSFVDNTTGPDNYYKLKMLNSQGTQAITSIIIRVTCQGCVYTPPTPVYCPYTINGPDQICNIQQITAYTLSSAVPNYSTINWSVDNTYAVKLTTYPAYDRTKVTLLKKYSAAGVTLTATLSGCSNPITKYITVGTPPPTINVYVGCPYLYASVMNAPGASSYTWWLTNNTQGTTTYNYYSSIAWDPNIGTGDIYNIGFSYTNACGTAETTSYGYYCPPDGGGPGGHDPWDPAPPDVPQLAVSPNPGSGVFQIGLVPPATTPEGLTPSAVKGTVVGAGAGESGLKSDDVKSTKIAVSVPKMYRVKVLDVSGVMRKEFSYPGGIERTSLDLSNLSNGVYIIQIYDSKRWVSGKIVVAK